MNEADKENNTSADAGVESSETTATDAGVESSETAATDAGVESSEAAATDAGVESSEAAATDAGVESSEAAAEDSQEEVDIRRVEGDWGILEFSISVDAMEVVLLEFIPGKEKDVDSVMTAFKEQGVVHGITEKDIVEIIDLAFEEKGWQGRSLVASGSLADPPGQVAFPCVEKIAAVEIY